MSKRYHHDDDDINKLFDCSRKHHSLLERERWKKEHNGYVSKQREKETNSNLFVHFVDHQTFTKDLDRKKNVGPKRTLKQKRNRILVTFDYVHHQRNDDGERMWRFFIVENHCGENKFS